MSLYIEDEDNVEEEEVSFDDEAQLDLFNDEDSDIL